MDRRILLVVISIVSCFFSLPLYAQEKTQPYYNTHESEILPDAGKTFLAGDYERTVELCKWHYIIVGDHSADSLRKKAQRCLQLVEEMDKHLVDGDLEAAKASATALLALNPDDVAAKAVVAKVKEPVANTVTEQPEQAEEVREKPEDVIEKAAETDMSEVNKPIETVEPIPESLTNKMRIAAKVSVSVLDLSRFAQTLAPGAGVDVYDIGGSRFGAGLGMFLCPYKAPDANGSIFGVDASLLFRAAKNIYPKVFAGAFKCRSKDETFGTTNGMRVGAGVSFILARHICLDAGVSFFPAVKLNGKETIVTQELQYSFLKEQSVLSASISPVISIGWAF